MNRTEEYDARKVLWTEYKKTVPFLLAFWAVIMYIGVTYG